VAVPDIVLDDRRFEDLVAEARRRIPGYTPEWTDLNDSDPGITIVQVFAWLTETILWRLNRVPDKSVVRFLRLLGVEPAPAAPARAALTFTVTDSPEHVVAVPQGTLVSAGSDPEGRAILFETDENLSAVNIQISAIQVYDGAQFERVNTAGDPAARVFYPFGEQPRRGAAWYLGLTARFPRGRFAITIDADEGDARAETRAVGVRLQAPTPPAHTVWEYWAGDDRGWQSLVVLTDTTFSLTESGAVTFEAPVTIPMAIAAKPVGLVPADTPMYWLRHRLVELLGPGYEIVPRVAAVLLNTVTATHAVTVSEELVGASDGTPDQQFTLANTPVVAGTLLLEVREAFDQDFRPWTAATDLGASSRDDRHFVVDLGTGRITFGDGRHGMIPPLVTDRREATERGGGDAPIANIRATRYRWGGGVAGNVGVGAIASLQAAVPFVDSVTNLRNAVGGSDAESFEEMRARAPLEIRTQSRAVTASDFEFLAIHTPGARIRRARALPLHHPELEPRRPAGAGQPVTAVPIPGVVTVVVVPHSEMRRPVVRPETLELVAAHLQRHRLITTEIYVAPPRFRKVEIEVRVMAKPDSSSGAVQQSLLARLLAYFHPLTGGEDGRGWPFGGTLFFSDTYRQILNSPGVLRVESDALITYLDDVEQPRCQDLLLRPDEIVWSDRHRVEVRYE
jgi:predicted phage baseplate assembly protein